MNPREAERFLDALAEVRAAGGRAASAVIVRVHGSAYRREGTRMLVRPDGTYECALSGGCLEPAVAEAAARVVATGEPALVSYDLADDSVWGLNIGCTGAVDIRIERIEEDEVTTAWLGALARGDAAVLMTPLSGASGRRVLFSTGQTRGRLSDGALEQKADARARARLEKAHPESGVDELDGAEVFFEVNPPPPALVIFGAGHDAVPLARLAWNLGFAVTVIDPRDAFLRADLFPGATLMAAVPGAPDRDVSLPSGSAVVVMNHHLDRDREALALALSSDVGYIGVLGPRTRYEQLLQQLVRDGRAPAPSMLARVHSPVGLALGAETPDEVAVAIVAEMLAVRRGFSGGFLSGSTGSLHRPAAAGVAAQA
jgi:xanthine/CO dehydrogenase XdhC/CoxF family maturation factor